MNKTILVLICLLPLSTYAANIPLPEMPPAPPGITQDLWKVYWNGISNENEGIAKAVHHYLKFYRHLFTDDTRVNPYSENDINCAALFMTKTLLWGVLKTAITNLPQDAMLHNDLRQAIAFVQDAIDRNKCNDPGNKGKQVMDAAARSLGRNAVPLRYEDMRVVISYKTTNQQSISAVMQRVDTWQGITNLQPNDRQWLQPIHQIGLANINGIGPAPAIGMEVPSSHLIVIGGVIIFCIIPNSNITLPTAINLALPQVQNSLR